MEPTKDDTNCVCHICKKDIRWVDMNTHVQACASNAGKCYLCGLSLSPNDKKEHMLRTCPTLKRVSSAHELDMEISASGRDRSYEIAAANNFEELSGQALVVYEGSPNQGADDFEELSGQALVVHEGSPNQGADDGPPAKFQKVSQVHSDFVHLKQECELVKYPLQLTGCICNFLRCVSCVERIGLAGGHSSPCGHIYCDPCMVNMPVSDKVKCGKCKKPFWKGGMRKLKLV